MKVMKSKQVSDECINEKYDGSLINDTQHFFLKKSIAISENLFCPQTISLGGGFKYFLFSPRTLGRYFPI